MAAKSKSRNKSKGTTPLEGSSSSSQQGLRPVLEQLGSTERRLRAIVGNLQPQLSPRDADLPVSIPVLFEKLRCDILTVQKENTRLREKLAEAERQVSDLQEETADLKKALQKEEEARNERDQEVMRRSVRILGLRAVSGNESPAECVDQVLTLLHDRLQLTSVRHADIRAAHRMGSPGEEPRPVLVKFHSRKLKIRVMMKRRLLKGTGILVVEDLTPLNMARLAKVKGHPNVKSCWSKDGRILALRKDDRKVLVSHGDLSILSDQACAKAKVMAPSPSDTSSVSGKSSDSFSRDDSSSDSDTSSDMQYTRKKYRSEKSVGSLVAQNSGLTPTPPSFTDSGPRHRLQPPAPRLSRWNPRRGSFRPPRRGYPFLPFQRGRPPFNYRPFRFSHRRPYRGMRSMYRRWHDEFMPRPRAREDSRAYAGSRTSHR